MRSPEPRCYIRVLWSIPIVAANVCPTRACRFSRRPSRVDPGQRSVKPYWMCHMMSSWHFSGRRYGVSDFKIVPYMPVAIKLIPISTGVISVRITKANIMSFSQYLNLPRGLRYTVCGFSVARLAAFACGTHSSPFAFKKPNMLSTKLFVPFPRPDPPPPATNTRCLT